MESSPKRPKISIYIATSIDGYIARPDGSLDWLDRVGGFDEDYGFQSFLNSIDGLIIGRKTYEVATTVPDPYPGKRVVVLSRSLERVKAGMELYCGDLQELLARLQREGIRHIWVDGGTALSQFLSAQLVDTMILSIIPVVLGSGIPLFSAIEKEIPLRLLSSQSYPSGLVQLQYERIEQFDNIHFKIISYGGDEYQKSVVLREKVLRRPLGLSFTPEELEGEREEIHVVGFLGEELCAAAVMTPHGERMKLQRVAVKSSFQGRGVGADLVAFCEGYAASHGYLAIYGGAIKTAIPFYLKQGFVSEGEPFDENGIVLYPMGKSIRP